MFLRIAIKFEFINVPPLPITCYLEKDLFFLSIILFKFSFLFCPDSFQLREKLFLRMAIKFEFINIPPIRILCYLEKDLFFLSFILFKFFCFFCPDSFQLREKLFLRIAIKFEFINVPPLLILVYLEKDLLFLSLIFFKLFFLSPQFFSTLRKIVF